MKIPKYKRDSFTFISNLSDYTANDKYPDTYKRDGYLLSEHYTNTKTLDLAQKVRRRRNLLISDNGNYSRMKTIAKKFEKEGLTLLQKAQEEQDDNGAISLQTKESRLKLMHQIAQKCQLDQSATDFSQVIATQLQINPHYMIGMEDLTIPVLMLCHLMHPVFSPDANQIIDYQQNTLHLFDGQTKGDLGFLQEQQKIANFLVLHAYDYDSAFQAAQNSLQISKGGVAISYGGPMHSRRWINELQIGGQTVLLPEKLPEAYLIAQTITLGVLNGDTSNIPYHILGVGTPILIALIGYQLRHSSAVSIDSTAPFKDAFIGKLYGRKHGFIKMDMFRLVAYCLVNDQPFEDNSPFYRDFLNKYGEDWKGIQQALHVRSTDNVRELAKTLKQRPDLLRKYLPFFTPITGSLDRTFMMDLRIARAGYNYWTIQYICKKVRAKKNNPAAFKRWIEKEVDKYTKVASRKWAKTVELTYQLTEKYRIPTD